VRSQILAAMGKCSTDATPGFLGGLPTAPPDTALCVGVAWGLYRAALRTHTTPQSTAVCVLLQNNIYPDTVRYAASCYLARAKNIDLTLQKNQIFSAFIINEKQNKIDININLTKAIGKINTPNAQRMLSAIAKGEYDYRQRINALIALKNYDYNQTRPAYLAAAQARNVQVATQATEILMQIAVKTDADTLQKIAAAQPNIRLKTNLIGTALRLQKNDSLSIFVANQVAAATQIYQKAYWITALSNDPTQHQLISTIALSGNEPVVRTAAMEAMIANFERTQLPEKTEFATLLNQALQTQDVALVSLAAAAIRNEKLALKTIFATEASINTLKIIQKKLRLPAEAEAYIEMAQTLCFLQNTPYIAPKMTQFAPLNWAKINAIKPHQTVQINTEKGAIVIRLLTNDAPATVANFLELIQKDFYKKNSVHRVVPNFVAQTGCPRGDGYGSPDQLIKSELSDLHYAEGTVGMASAGKDTESSQWFFTHGYVPHLDGKYTIFAQVIKGYNAMHQLEVGDRVYSYELLP
jgi:cyclophilin family peptidyl-prolyl cis-trans isomerase